MRNWWLCRAVSCCCLVVFAAAGQCEYFSSSTDPCEQSPDYASCANYYQVFASLDYQNFSSPNYPNYYPNNIVCHWVVSACQCRDPSNPNAEYRVEIEVTDYDMPNSPSCTKDFLEIKDGKRLWDQRFSQFCGNKCASGNNNVTRSFGMHLLATFQAAVASASDPARFRGFFARYRCVAVVKPLSSNLVLGPVNYVLITMSCILAVVFSAAVALLVIQEKRRNDNLFK